MTQRGMLIAVFVLVATGCAQGSSSSSPAAAKEPQGIVIQFGDMSVRPAVAHAKQGTSVAWTTMATSYHGVVSFADSIVPHFTCKELRPDFFEAGGRIQSIPVSEGNEDVVLPCPLEPGSYEYRIDLYSSAEKIGMNDPQRSLHGKLIVE